MTPQTPTDSSAERRAIASRAARVQEIVDDCLARRMSGAEIDEARIIAAHADLLPELRAALRHLQLVHAACQVVGESDVPSAENGTRRGHSTTEEAHCDSSAIIELLDSTPRFASGHDSSLTVRCPHCHSPTPLESESNLSTLTCPSCGNAFSLIGEAADELPLAGTFGHFTILKHLGSGGFGAVYQAHDTQLDRVVALKVPRRGQLTANEADKFLREARTAAQLRHPHIVSVHEVGRHADTFYIVSDFIDGESLAARLTREPLTAREAAALCQKMAAALHHAHESGIVHRDLKPANVLLDRSGEPHITDFGLARREAGEVTLTMDGVVIGTPAYMSPEQARGESHRADRRSDIYSLGVILFELLTGELPFRGNVRMVTEQILNEEPPSPRKLNSTTPHDLETITLKCLEKDPARRYATAKDLADDLDRFLCGEPIVARPIGRTARSWRWCKRNPRVAGLSAAVLSLLLTIGVAASLLAWRETIRRQTAVAQERDTYRRLYFSDMHGGVEALAAGNVGRVMELLDRHRPQPDREDLRGFEWYFLWQQCQRGLSQRTIQYGGPITCVAISSDGTKIAAGGGAITRFHDDAYTAFDVKVWNLRTGELLDTFLTSGLAREVRFSPDGSSLVCREEYAVTVWDLANGAQRFSRQDDSLNNSALALSADGEILAAVTDKHKLIRLWNTKTHQSLPAIDVEMAPSYSLAFSSDRELLASADGDGNISLWETSTGQRRYVLRNNCGHSIPVCFTADSKSLITGGPAGTIIVWNLKSRTPEIRAGHSAKLVSLALSHDGALLASAGIDGTIKLWDTHQFEPIDTLLGTTGKLGAVALAGDGRTLAAGDTNGIVRIWDLSQPPSRDELKGHTTGVICVAVSPDDKRAASCDEQGTVRIWDIASGNELKVAPPHTGEFWCIAFDTTGNILACGGADGRIRLWNYITGETTELEGHQSWVQKLAFTPDGEFLISSGGDGTVRIWGLGAWQRRQVNMPTYAGVGIAISPDGGLVAAEGVGRGALEVRDTQTNDRLHTLPRDTQSLTPLAFSANGQSLATTGQPTAIKLWDCESERELHTLLGHVDTVTGAAFSPDRKTLASASDDGTIRLWDLATGGERVVLRGHSGKVYCLAFSPDGRTLISGGEDKTVHVWRAASEDDVPTADKSGGNRGYASSTPQPQAPISTSPITFPITPADWQIDYYEWKQAPGPWDSPPESWENVLKSQRKARERVGAIDFDWGIGSPAKGVSADFFALVASTSIELDEGTYTLTTVADDGVRVYLDGQLAIDNWAGHPAAMNTSVIEVNAGPHEIRIEFFDILGPAILQFGISPSPSHRGTELRQRRERLPRISRPIPVSDAEWTIAFHQWNRGNRPPDSPPASWEDVVNSPPIRIERAPTIDFFWGPDPPARGVPSDNFAVIATTSVELADGNYTLLTLADDGVRVFLDGKVIIEDWTAHAAWRNVGYADVKAGKHDIRIEFFEAGGDATLQFGIFPTPTR